MTKPIALAIAERLLQDQPTSALEISAITKKVAKQVKQGLPPYSEIIAALKQLAHNSKTIKPSQVADHAQVAGLIKLLKKRAVRTLSGVAPVAVLVKPYPCPGRCAFCPTELSVPKSYLSNEPAVMRAIRCDYDPAAQIHFRLKALLANGHQPEKIELIVIGGTWSYLPDKYKYWYIASCFFAANHFQRKASYLPLKETATLAQLKKWLAKEQLINETAAYRLIGITLETRPDYLDHKELAQMRALGATRIELGVQAIDDEILKKNLRESTVADIQRATALALAYGFKLTYHIMPGLPGSNPEKDIVMYRGLFSQEDQITVFRTPASVSLTAKTAAYLLQTALPDNPYNPDQIKLYPTVVTKGSLLYRWWKAGKYHTYDDDSLAEVIVACKEATPPWTRIVRLVRDIPAESIVAGSKISNFRQLIQQRGAHCRCIRCREAQGRVADLAATDLIIRKYRHASADEYFISFESADGKTIYGFLRLRLASMSPLLELQNTALIRELHVYGELARLGHAGTVQHLGMGKRLMAIAEQLSRQSGQAKIAVISGVGVRDYYRHLGYRRNGTYMVKRLK
ncbi:MAG: elongator complex protein 3 [Candidatus Falkowbacteria bacterium]